MDVMGKLQHNTRGNNKRKYGCAVAIWRRSLGYQQYNRSSYHLLSRALCQRVTVAQVINLNVLDIVSIINVDFSVEASRRIVRGWRCGFRYGASCLIDQLAILTQKP